MSKHEFEQGGKEHVIQLKDAGNHVVEALIAAAGAASESVRFVPTDLGGGRYLLRVGDEVHDVRVERDPKGPGVRVHFAAGSVTLEKLDPFRDSVRKGKHGGGTKKINAPIPGRVVDVLVKAGDDVAAGQPVVIVEAMKMANELRAPIAGRVTRVDAVKGAAVEAGTTLVVIEG
jgi:biotin carboxyl carrier protein